MSCRVAGTAASPVPRLAGTLVFLASPDSRSRGGRLSRGFAPDMRGYGGTSAPEAIDAYRSIISSATWWRSSPNSAKDAGDDHRSRLGRNRRLAMRHVQTNVFPAVVAIRCRSDDARRHARWTFSSSRASAHSTGNISRSLEKSSRWNSPATGAIPCARSITARDWACCSSRTRYGRGRERSGEAAGMDQRRRDRALHVKEFSRTGLAGGINWYRNIDRNWGSDRAWQDAKIHQPVALFIAGAGLVITGPDRREVRCRRCRRSCPVFARR